VSNQNKRQILKTAETRFKTIMIGSIARVEDYFGYLWAHGKDTPTERQEEFRALWDELRNEILNHGNFHIRKGLDEIEEWVDYNNERYEYKFIMNEKRRENNGRE
jgi:hypothetical protein